MRLVKTVCKFGLLPIFFYFFFFCFLTYPAILSFSTHFFADAVDGLQNVWNIWWVNKAITVLHESPWKTSYLHFPYGTTLLGHTLNPFNGLIGILPLRFFSLLQTYNGIVIFTFIASGFAMFILAFYLTRAYFASLLSGYMFTFSNYHFSHAAGHLQLLSLEWIPLFVFSWFLFLRKPRFITALSSFVILFFILLCDYYYFFYSIIFGLFYFVYHICKFNPAVYIKKNALILSLFLLGIIGTTGPILFSLFIANIRDPFVGGHPAVVFSNDLLGFLIPGGNWKFSALTKFYWFHLPGNMDEKSVHLGISVLVILVFLWIKRKKKLVPDYQFWLFTGGFFFVLSLGPQLEIFGKNTHIPLPYLLFEKLFPPLELSGMPVRMMSMVIFVAAILFAYGIKEICKNGKIVSIVIIVIVLFLEYLPHHFTAANYEVPKFVSQLSRLPYGAVVINASITPGKLLYYQTFFGKPMAFGYISRLQESLLVNDLLLEEVITKQNYLLLCEYNFRYLVITASGKSNVSTFPLGKPIYADREVNIYDLSPACQSLKTKVS